MLQLCQYQQPCNSSWRGWKPSTRGWEVTRLKMNADKTQLIWLGTKQQLNKLSVTGLSAVCQGGLVVYGLRPRFYSGQTSDHERPHIGSVSVLLLAATSTPTCQVVADVWHRNDTCTCLHQQPSWLLQQLAVRCRWRVVEETTRRSECSCSGGDCDANKKVRPHHAGASWPPLASSQSED